MGKYTKEFGILVDTIITECSLYPPVDYTKQPLPEPVTVKEAMWDTGAAKHQGYHLQQDAPRQRTPHLYAYTNSR